MHLLTPLRHVSTSHTHTHPYCKSYLGSARTVYTPYMPYTHAHTRTHTRTHTHTHTQTLVINHTPASLTHKPLYKHMHRHMHIHMHGCTRTNTCPHAYAHVHVHKHGCTHTNTCTHAYKHMHIHTHGCTYAQTHTHGCTHTHTHTRTLQNTCTPAHLYTQRIRQRMASDGGPPPGRLPKPDVVLASYEAVCADILGLKAIPWETVVVDIRQRWVDMKWFVE